MTETSKKMICTNCGAEMNHHSDKLVQASDLEVSASDSGLNGAIEEFHTCPKCGSSASRHA